MEPKYPQISVEPPPGGDAVDFRARVAKKIKAVIGDEASKEYVAETNALMGSPAQLVHVTRTWVIVRSEISASEQAAALHAIPGRLDGPIEIHIENCEIVGGAGFPLRVGQIVTLRFHEEGYTIFPEYADPVSGGYDHLEGIALSGPGRETTGGGFIGGGFGLEGAAAGMAIAALLNALTTTTTVTSVIELTTTDGELFLVNGTLEPTTLRFMLSPALVRLRVAHARNS